VQQRAAIPSVARRPADVVLEPAHLQPHHALASAAVPLLFPAVEVDGQLYCDGGLRQLVPLWPALRLGADALIVVSPRSETVDETPAARQRRERAVVSPVYLAGKSLDALLLDHVDEDVDRMQQTNAILRAGSRRYGPEFVTEINRELRREGAHDLRPVRAAVVRPSRDIGALAAEFVRSPGFTRRRPSLAALALRLLAEADGSRETDLISYLLFDGEFAELLIELGRQDARNRHDELCSLYEASARAA
jgi:NTE family protein